MTIIPGQSAIERFTVDFRGSFGRFRTQSSHALHYLQTTLRTNDLHRLTTASEAFDIREIDFEELIQRDIDPGRVAKIADDYLSAGKNRPIFFPPLLACVVVLDENRKPKTFYDSVDYKRKEDENPKVLRTVFDKDGFRLDLYESTAEYSDRTISWEGVGVPLPFLDYVAKLSINPDRCKLVVLDGQHRLQALKRLLNTPETREIVSSIEQPICIAWMPFAQQGSEEHIVQDLRDVFVTVNTKSRLVSGHFTLLLSDNSYAAVTVRSLANAWKRDESGGWTRLHLLEWNTREDTNTERRKRKFSITTVTIVANVLETFLFNAPGLASALLKLEDRSEDFSKAEPNFDFHVLRDEARGLRVNQIVGEQIGRHLVPALDHLLRKLRPYAALEQLLGATFSEQQEQISRGGSPGASNLRRYLDRFVYQSDEMQDDLSKNAWEEFRTKVAPPAEDNVYFLSVFQQGYLRLWLSLSRHLIAFGVSALDSARATVSATDLFAANLRLAYLQDEKPYVQRMLWKNGTVNFNSVSARDAWSDIQLAAFLRRDVIEASIKALPTDALTSEQIEQFKQQITDLATRAAHRYTAKLKLEITNDIKRNLAFFFGEIRAGVLRDLRLSNPDEFDEEIAAVAKKEFATALESLAAALQVKASQLLSVE